ncbi:homoserine dehydrogenase [Limnoraphis robusta Tam1]|uniref:Homoserine dehydrogenase n=1 Tax=Limnoraphis robusta CCNP1315 TaxID=3110306 RepID=A0ABU5U7M8_9CYAN|nr:homoserine dehydrogenase [Limnoraphis robusta]MEA5500956.1 homoserine dehydrogenase [Limnoraphis robusta BA-68 BA1]MEA5523208.1 homoserine dehydrogenase [Limnoraphis robusta CCNP1315]MEA5540884.1 homoserine dehydrogenase [Limnoraphis robusta Tam1]MEA5549194.1 homoserine dehydrogenase [Limnoraphis robusta CCNP1324]
MALKIGLLGLGTVGTGTAQILLDPNGRHPLLQGLSLHRVGVRSLSKSRQVELPESLLTTDLEEIVTDPQVDIVVELIGGLEPARSLILKAIAHGKHVVTANKAVISRYADEIFTAANEKGVYVMLEAAVGGGIPVIQPLKQSLGANRIHRIMGIVNGTTNYILTRMQQEGADFAEVLAQAQQLGYAEADPTADVDGLDAADKIAILASLAFGGRIKLSEVYCEGIRNINASDISYADRLGFVIKLLAIASRDPQATPENDLLSIRVHPTLVPKAHPLASINDVYNAILIEGEPIGQVMFFGRGAGAGPTASAVVSDILNIAAVLHSPVSGELHPLMSCSHQHYCNLAPMENLMTRFYSRFVTQDEPGVIGKLGTCFGSHDVSIESIVQIDTHGELAEIVVVTHDVREGNFRQALDEIKSFNVVNRIPSILRVL